MCLCCRKSLNFRLLHESLLWICPLFQSRVNISVKGAVYHGAPWRHSSLQNRIYSEVYTDIPVHTNITYITSNRRGFLWRYWAINVTVYTVYPHCWFPRCCGHYAEDLFYCGFQELWKTSTIFSNWKHKWAHKFHVLHVFTFHSPLKMFEIEPKLHTNMYR